MTNKHKDIDLNALLKDIGENWTPEDDENINKATRSAKVSIATKGRKRSPEAVMKSALAKKENLIQKKLKQKYL